MTELNELIFLVIEDIVCPVHGKRITEFGVSEDEKISFVPCCPELGRQVNEAIYCTINEYNRQPELNKPRNGDVDKT